MTAYAPDDFFHAVEAREDAAMTPERAPAKDYGDLSGRALWNALSDEEPVPFDEPGGFDDLWELLTVKQQQAVARGDVTFEELLERITSAADAETCPRCGCRTISPRYARLGVCATCARELLNAAFHERIAEVEAFRESNVMKQKLARARDAAGIRRPRGGGLSRRIEPTAAATGRHWAIDADELVHVECVTCSELFTPHGDERECAPCRERRERREAVRHSNR